MYASTKSQLPPANPQPKPFGMYIAVWSTAEISATKSSPLNNAG